MSVPKWRVIRIDSDDETDLTDVYLEETPRHIGASLRFWSYVARGLSSEQASYFRLGETYDLSNPCEVPDNLIAWPMESVGYDAVAGDAS